VYEGGRVAPIHNMLRPQSTDTPANVAMLMRMHMCVHRAAEEGLGDPKALSKEDLAAVYERCVAGALATLVYLLGKRQGLVCAFLQPTCVDGGFSISLCERERERLRKVSRGGAGWGGGGTQRWCGMRMWSACWGRCLISGRFGHMGDMLVLLCAAVSHASSLPPPAPAQVPPRPNSSDETHRQTTH
jgi:hypothetical protein